MTSEYGGFYVIYKRPEQIDLDKKQEIIKALQSSKNKKEFLKCFKDKAQRKKYDSLYQKYLNKDELYNYLNQEYQLFAVGKIIAQSWAWLSEDDALVLDSWERLREEDDRLCEPFIMALAEHILKDIGIKKSVQQTESKVDNKHTLHHPYPSFLQSSANIFREPLHNEGEIKLFLKDILSDEINLGNAISKGDCFFDSVAQSLNQREGKKLFDVKSLRLLCDEYAKNPKNSWVEIANKKDREDHDSYLVIISFTAPELLEKEAQGLKLETAVWGRPKIDGRIFCEQFNIRIHVIEIQEDGTVNRHLVDRNGETEDYNPSVDYKDNNILHIVNYHNHFVPLIRSSVLEAVEIKYQLPMIVIAERSRIKRVLLGKGGNTPTNVSFQDFKKSVNPKDYFDYRDSLQQYLVKEQSELIQNNAVVLSQGIGLFAHVAHLEVIHSYSAEQINKLLQHFFSAHKQFIVFPVIYMKNFNENEISKYLVNFKNIKIDDCTKIITCIMPVLTAEKFWTVVIIQRGVNFHYNNQDSWTLVNYLDFAGKAMPKELMQLLVNAQLLKLNSHNIYRSTASYNTDPSISDIWLIENLRSFAETNILNIKPLYKEDFNQIKERNRKTLTAIQDNESNNGIEESAIILNL